MDYSDEENEGNGENNKTFSQCATLLIPELGTLSENNNPNQGLYRCNFCPNEKTISADKSSRSNVKRHLEIIVASPASYSPIIQTGYFRNSDGWVHKVYWNYQSIRLYSNKNNEKIGDQKYGFNGNPKFGSAEQNEVDGGVTYSFKELFVNIDKTLIELKQSMSNLEGKMHLSVSNLKEEMQKECHSLTLQMVQENYTLRNRMNNIVTLLFVAGLAFLYVAKDIFSISIKKNMTEKNSALKEDREEKSKDD